MKKLILPIILLLTVAFFLPQNLNAQSEPDCRKIFDKENYQCLKDSSACQDACLKETEKPDGTAYFNSGEIYQKCLKASDCSGKSNTCSEKALVNFRACGKSGKQPKTAEAQKETPKFIEIVNNLSLDTVTVTFLDSRDFEQSQAGADSDIPQDIKDLFEKFRPMTNEEFQRLWNSRPKDISEGENKIVDIENGQDQKKGYWWGKEDGAVMSSPSWKNIKFKEPVKVEGVTSHTVELEQGEIEVKVRNNNPAENQFGVDAGWLGVTVSRTHFWVSQSQDKKMAVIGVYEGEVEVKTRDGKIVKVSPEEDPSTGSGQGKPGVVVVTRKLSPVKLVLAGLVVAAVIGGALVIVRRKFSSKGLNKKRK